MKRFLALLISVLMVVFSAAVVFAAPEGDSGDSGESGESEETMAVGGIAGGWTVFDAEEGTVLPEEVQAAFDKAMEGFVGMNYKPVAFLGSQVVAGTNYMVLCTGAPVVPDPETGLYVLVIYADLEGNASITNVTDFNLGDIEGTLNEEPDTETEVPEGESEDGESAEGESAEGESEEGESAEGESEDGESSAMMAGGWTVPEEAAAAALPQDAADAFSAATEGLVGVGYVPAALLGTKVIAGTEYAVLVHGTTVTAQPESFYAVMFIAANVDNTCDMMGIARLNLADYNETAVEE